MALILYWKIITAPDAPFKVEIFHFLVLEFLCAERMLRFKKLKRDYYNAYERRQETVEDGDSGVG